MPWQCFMTEPTELARQTLRRYTSISTAMVCPAHPGGWGHHDASMPIEQVAYPLGDTNGYGADDWPHDDPRWPTHCACGYEFRLDDEWQHHVSRLYRPVGGGAMFILRPSEIAVGAIWEAPWLPAAWRGPDGRCLVLMTPGGEWMIDGPSRDGGRWTRTGEPPRITARPSILVPGVYHGWLTDGVLSDDLDGRRFPPPGELSGGKA